MSQKEELQEKLDESRFAGVYSKIDANNKLVNFQIDTNHKELSKKIDSNQEKTLLVLNQILTKTKATNGRVSKLEVETNFFRVIYKYPKVAILSIIGVLTISQIENIWKLVIKIF